MQLRAKAYRQKLVVTLTLTLRFLYVQGSALFMNIVVVDVSGAVGKKIHAALDSDEVVIKAGVCVCM